MTIVIGMSEAYWICGALVLMLGFIFLAYVRFQVSIARTHQKLLDQFELMTKTLVRSDQEVVSSLSRSKLVPDGHVLVSLQEASSLHPLPNGYIMKIERKFEHRAVAETVLGRALAPHEVVHHIYAPKTDDNRPENLCVLDRDQHDIFHTYLQREKALKGKYPAIADQKRVLKNYFGGILIEEALEQKTHQFPPVKTYVEKFSLEKTETTQH